LIRRSISRL